MIMAIMAWVVLQDITDASPQDAVNHLIESAKLVEALCGYREVASCYCLCVGQFPRALARVFPSSVIGRSACSLLEPNRGATKHG